MSDKVTDIPVRKIFHQNQEFFDRLEEVIADFDGKVSLAEAIGVLELLKADLMTR
ncbi:hypothetical protein [Erwinia persicina]|uniref:hypothetical protein n=1 Tax=Erwinia persicina TaxID=55211 RepID=UPI001785B673|nr:hypothetical protein [Erwinia persicina]MBD8168649.1 hypothetical protein [Erwinia persicina]